MDKKIVVLVHIGLPYRKTIKYASERAREIGAKVTLLGVISEFGDNDRAALAMHEIAPYDAVRAGMERDIVAFFEKAVQFCLDNNITVDTRIERGEIEEVLKQTARDIYTKLIVVPAPTKHQHHLPFLDTIRQFAHNMLDHDLRCAVVSVLAA
jgi:hypothetical protein